METREHHLGKKEDKENFDDLIHDLQHHHKNDKNSNYVPEHSDENDNSLGLWEEEYVAMDEEEGIIVTDDDIYKSGDKSYHEYRRG